jgi:hypothetical protein
LFQLLTQRQVQEDLHLPEKRMSELARVVETQHARMRDSFAQGREAWNSVVEEVIAERRAALDDLEPGQVERLRQIGWQQRGIAAFAHPDVKQRLELTAEQEDRIHAIMSGSRAPQAGFRGPRDRRFPPPWPPEDEPTLLMNRVLAVLTSEQLARWKEMTGKPLKAESRPTFSGPPMGRDPRRPR